MSYVACIVALILNAYNIYITSYTAFEDTKTYLTLGLFITIGLVALITLANLVLSDRMIQCHTKLLNHKIALKKKQTSADLMRKAS